MMQRQKLFRIVGIVSALVLIPAWFCSAILDNSYVNWSRQPSPELGETLPYAVKGIIVYVRPWDRNLVTWLDRIEIASGAVLFVSLILSGELLRKLRGK